MPRNITSAFRQLAESSFRDEVDLCFLTITHDDLAESIRVVWDTKDFIYDGETFIGFPFDFEILSDDEQPPQARLSIQNVDPQIGESIRTLSSPPRLKIELLSSDDFDLNADPRTEVAGSPGATVIYSADQLFLIDVTVDIMVISGRIVGWDYLQRVWPGQRATEATFPGLFR